MGSLKNDGDGGTNVHFAFQLDAGVVDAGNVLDDGKPKPGAAGVKSMFLIIILSVLSVQFAFIIGQFL